MIRVGIDARYGLRAQRRGIGTYVYHLLSEWATTPPEDIEITAFCDGRADPTIVRTFAAAPGRIAVTRVGGKPFPLWEQVALPRAIPKARLDLFHATSNVAPATCPVPLVATIFDTIEWHRGRDFPADLPARLRLARRYRMFATLAAARRARLVLTASAHAAASIEADLHVASSKLRTTPLGAEKQVSPGRADLRILEDNSLEPRGYALAFGAEDPRKGTGMLLGIWSATRMPLPLVVCGMEPTERPIPAGVHLLPFVPDGQMAALLNNAAMLLYPSAAEGFGLPVVDAMAAGVPVIAASGTAAEETAAGAASTAPAGDAGAWAGAVTRLAGDAGLRGRLSKEGREAANRYSWSATAQLTLAAYREALL